MRAARYPAPMLCPSRRIFVLAVLLTVPAEVRAQSDRLIELSFTPTERAQIAIWIERSDGTFMGTARLTEAVSLRGIGNRPGAMQMNSGFRWPYGRRESVLPIWAHRRANADGASSFPRVIFQDRASEGFASRTSVDASRDDYFCLSFDKATTQRDALDAVTCASVFNSDKGRFIRATDVSSGYSEPFVESGDEVFRPLSATSLYPPRRDAAGTGSDDHPDAQTFHDVAKMIMPDIDAITMATPPGETPQIVQFTAPTDWPDGEYTAWIEIHVEGDYNETYNDLTYPTPSSDAWDFWAETYGYPYRGQPSVVYSVPFELGHGAVFETTNTVAGFGSLDGQDGNIRPTDDSITDDPIAAPGSGADRLRMDVRGARFAVAVLPTSVCAQPDAPIECGQSCNDETPCSDPQLICGPDHECVGICDAVMPPDAVEDLHLDNHPDVKLAHRLATLSFTIPDSPRALRNYVIKSSLSEIDLSTWEGAEPAKAPATDGNGKKIAAPGAALQVPVQSDCSDDSDSALCSAFHADPDGICPSGFDVNGDGDCLDPGDRISVDIAFLSHETNYYVGVRTSDICQALSDLKTAEITTTPIRFTKVSPCFVATAAYGTPFASEIWALRRFREQFMRPTRLGRAAISAYDFAGPYAANFIRDRPWLRTLTRTILTPLVGLAKWMTSSADNPGAH